MYLEEEFTRNSEKPLKVEWCSILSTTRSCALRLADRRGFAWRHIRGQMSQSAETRKQESPVVVVESKRRRDFEASRRRR
jgi:hypothetical protein